MRVHPRIGQRAADQLEQVVVPQAGAREVDGAGVHRRQARLVLAPGQSLQRVADDPAVDRGHHAVVLGRRDEGAGRNQLAVVLAQAQQHLHVQATFAAGLQGRDGLGVQLELVVLQRQAQPPHPVHLALAAAHLDVFRLVDEDAVAPAFLGAVAGHVGHAHGLLDGGERGDELHHADGQAGAQLLAAPGQP